MNEKNRYATEYWRLKNRIGYAVVSGDKTKRREAEKELKLFMEGRSR